MASQHSFSHCFLRRLRKAVSLHSDGRVLIAGGYDDEYLTREPASRGAG